MPYGWTERIGAHFDEVRRTDPDVVLGRVGRVDRGECDVFAAEGVLRVASDSQRAQRELAPTTGDWVAVGEDPDLGLVITAVLDRGNTIVRRDPSEQVVEQVLVSNVDVVAVVHGLDRALNLAQLERFLVLAWDSGAQPLIVLTKADLCDDIPGAVAMASVSDNIDVLVTSAETGEGVDLLQAQLEGGRTLVMIGPSGVGKSHLVNALLGDEVQSVGEVRAGDAKGRHTTITRDLLLVPAGGVVIDTPGIRAVGVWEADAALDRVFSDIAELAEDCRFRDCTHRTEPKCAVQAAVSSGALNPDRLDRYLQLWDEITEQSADAVERHRRQTAGRKQPRRGSQRSDDSQ